MSSAEAQDVDSGRVPPTEFLGSRAEAEREQTGSPTSTPPPTATPPSAPPSPASASRPTAPFVREPPPPPPPSQAPFRPVPFPAQTPVPPPYQPVASAPRAPIYSAPPYPAYPPPAAKGPFRPARPKAGRRFLAALFLILVTVILYALITPATKPPAPTLSANPNPIQRGQRTVLHWSAKDYSTVELDGARVDATGSRAVYPSVSTTYRLVATEKNGTPDIAEARVIVQNPPRSPARKPHAE